MFDNFVWKQSVNQIDLNGKFEYHIQKVVVDPTRTNYQRSKNNFATVDRAANRRLIWVDWLKTMFHNYYYTFTSKCCEIELQGSTSCSEVLFTTSKNVVSDMFRLNQLLDLSNVETPLRWQ